MILIKEAMVRKIHLNKYRKKKKAMTLIEVICALCIIVILFLAISSLMMMAAKQEERTDNNLDNLSYSKAITDIMSSRTLDEYKALGGSNKYYYLQFDSMDELQGLFNDGICKGDKSINDNLKPEIEMSYEKAKEMQNLSKKKYMCCIKVKYVYKEVDENKGELFYIKVTMWNMERDNGNEIYKEMYIAQ